MVDTYVPIFVKYLHPSERWQHSAGAVVLFFQIIIVIFDLSNSDGDGQTFSFEGVRLAGVPVTKTP